MASATGGVAGGSGALPEAPQPQGRFSASISGTVVDTRGAPVQGAEISLTGKQPPVRRRMAADAQGAFRFEGLAADTYQVTVRAAGMQPAEGVTIPLGRGEAYKLPITLQPLPQFTDTVRVTASPLAVATAQVHEQEKQRVLGVVPNFYTSYLWNAAPMSTKLKYHLAIRSLIDPITIAGSAAVAGAEQWQNVYPGYGSGGVGYAKRFGATYADSIDARLLGRALLPGIFHQDPRYFYRGSGSVGTRFGYAVAQEVMCRGDNGKRQFAYARLLGDFAAAGISNIYHAPEDRGAAITFRDAGVIVGTNAAENVLIEFVTRTLTTHVPAFENGKKSRRK
ncbi:MAG: carboxypeptidase-like regulatory domain-containing protein [Acidobacteriota bacterium]